MNDIYSRMELIRGLEEKYKHIRYIFKRAVNSGNINLEVYGTENIPDENGFLLYANHQGLFDIIAITAAMEKPWAAVLKKEYQHFPAANGVPLWHTESVLLP